MPAALLYNLAPAKEKALLALCDAQGVQGRAVAPADQGRALGDLLGLPVPATPAESTPAELVPGEMLVLSGFDGPALDAFLGGFAAAGVPPIPLKAVVTAYNLAWTAPQLYRELSREHQALGRRP